MTVANQEIHQLAMANKHSQTDTAVWTKNETWPKRLQKHNDCVKRGIRVRTVLGTQCVTSAVTFWVVCKAITNGLEARLEKNFTEKILSPRAEFSYTVYIQPDCVTGPVPNRYASEYLERTLQVLFKLWPILMALVEFTYTYSKSYPTPCDLQDSGGGVLTPSLFKSCISLFVLPSNTGGSKADGK